jgi:hypothetical protein
MNDSPGQRLWFPVPGMYGCFDITLRQGRLDVRSWCRVVGGSGQTHLVTHEGAVPHRSRIRVITTSTAGDRDEGPRRSAKGSDPYQRTAEGNGRQIHLYVVPASGRLTQPCRGGWGDDQLSYLAVRGETGWVVTRSVAGAGVIVLGEPTGTLRAAKALAQADLEIRASVITGCCTAVALGVTASAAQTDTAPNGLALVGSRASELVIGR